MKSKKVGVSLPDFYVMKVKEEELDLTLFFTKVLEVRYSDKRQELLSLLEQDEDKPITESIIEKNAFEQYVYPYWEAYERYIIPHQIKGKSWRPETPPYERNDLSPDLFILSQSNGKANVSKGYIHKHWSEIIAGNLEFDRKRGGV